MNDVLDVSNGINNLKDIKTSETEASDLHYGVKWQHKAVDLCVCVC